jgi:O-antigen ligase
MIRGWNIGRAGKDGWGWTAAIAAMLVLGGANWTMPLSRFLAELAGVGLLLAAIVAPGRRDNLRMTVPDWLWVALLALFTFHLLPLPPAVWTQLPGRELAALADRSVFGATGWRPLTLDPEATWRSLLMLLPAFSAYLALRLGDGERRAALLRGVAIAAIAAIAIAFMQLALPAKAWLHFYPRGDYEEPTGFFTNRNHQATFLLCALPLAACWLLPKKQDARAAWQAAGLLLSAGAGIAALAVLATGSRTAAALLPLALAATAIAWVQAGDIAALASLKGNRALRLLAFAAGLLAVFAAVIVMIAGLGGDDIAQVLRRTPVLDDNRLDFWPHVAGAAGHFWPVGSGIGTFLDAYEMHEPLEALRPLYVNHAHNDFLEIFLEAGAPGLVLALAGTWELGMMGWRAWRAPPHQALAAAPARLASVVIALPIAHSLVDYPLRTVSISVLFALAAAILASQDSSPDKGLPVE